VSFCWLPDRHAGVGGSPAKPPPRCAQIGLKWVCAPANSARYTEQNPWKHGPSGRVAQWESARFTRERSVVRNPPRPLREGLQMASLFGGQTIAPDVAGVLTRVITRKTPRWRTSPRSVRGFAPVPGGPSTPATASWRVWSPAITGRLGLPRRRASRLGVAPTCSLPRRPRCCFGWDSSSSTRTQRSSAGELEGRPGDGTTQRRQAHPRPSE
jgi:hypothetical protein